jgi:hypothetical protein
MKRLVFLFAVFMVIATGAMAQQPASPYAVELSFTFNRQIGPGSNQFAAWIEDAKGGYIKTLYATRFTANGGWKRRETSIPLWVKKSALAALSKDQVDALTGATPGAGTLTYRWDGTDSRGAALPAGDYVVILEATLRNDNQVYYRAPVRIGQGAGNTQVSVEYAGTGAEKERAMISGVTVKVLR